MLLGWNWFVLECTFICVVLFKSFFLPKSYISNELTIKSQATPKIANLWDLFWVWVWVWRQIFLKLNNTVLITCNFQFLFKFKYFFNFCNNFFTVNVGNFGKFIRFIFLYDVCFFLLYFFFFYLHFPFLNLKFTFTFSKPQLFA